MAFGKINKLFEPVDEKDNTSITEDEFYTITNEEAKKGDKSNKMILIEPRAYSESQDIADHLKARNSVVINFKRVTADQSKRIIDFVSGTLYAIGGDLQKIGDGIFLCTPKNIDVQGEITEDNSKDNGEDW